MGNVKVACLVAVLMAMVLVAEGAISCSTVTSILSPCLNYMRNAGTVPPPCCNAMSTLEGSSPTTADRQAVCGCLKMAATAIKRINDTLVQGLPNSCGVDMHYTFSAQTDCSKIT
ncbi:non-specific lipid-transfer protein 1 [Amborella trichopoda]|uniref:non-specific lipid-transfer protein 1 n=1 Tax=Amborella trichopoda TaxID=13333 RepID=UPI0005D4619C|nr:non-specific lipid-transfer protein 1 [Amborella trichopoda]|eukprot:XP_006842465.2 non-specific lipid-transfer protein 1 [Amborella trichopoda]